MADVAHRLDYEEPYLGLPRDGLVLMTVGGLLLATAMIPASYLYQGYRAGSNFCLIWAAIQGGLGVLLTGIGLRLERKHDSLERDVLERWILSDETTP
jgi:hypothetical protein